MSDALIPKTNSTVGSATFPLPAALVVGELAENKFVGRLAMKLEDLSVKDPAKVILSGDASGTTATATNAADGGTVPVVVTGLQGVAMTTSAPANLQAMVYDSVLTKYRPQSIQLSSSPAATADALTTATGAAPSYSIRAWCTFDGSVTGTNAPTLGGNIATITRTSTGFYTVNFTVAMPHNYFTVMITTSPTAANNLCIAHPCCNNSNVFTAPTASSFVFRVTDPAASSVLDSKRISIHVMF